MKPDSIQNTPEEQSGSLKATVEPDGPGEGVLTDHSEVFTGSEEDFRGRRK